MLVFPNAKINLGLNITEKRTSDGYHLLETIFVPVNWCDVLEIQENDTLEFESNGITIPSVSANNLCVKAYLMLQKMFDIPMVKILLQKNIPIGAGMGGGSADAAFMLKALNKKFNLSLNRSQLKNLALKLGADCPFFIENKAVYATGIGDKLETIDLNFHHKKIVLVYPNVEVSTPWAYSQITPKPANYNLKQTVLNTDIAAWENILINDFEEPIFQAFPRIRDAKISMYMNGALFAAMSGSGSSVFGIFDEKTDLYNLEITLRDKGYPHRILNL